MSRTKRKPYTGSKAVDPSCRGKGKCPWCVGNRLHKHQRKLTEEAIEHSKKFWDNHKIGDPIEFR